MSDWIAKARRDFGRFNFSELSVAGWILLLVSFSIMIATGYIAFSFVDKAQANSRLSENAAAAICVGAGIASYLGGRVLLSVTGISTRAAARSQTRPEAG
jgi:NO-binding membrane sensor protein with MHYT domain